MRNLSKLQLATLVSLCLSLVSIVTSSISLSELHALRLEVEKEKTGHAFEALIQNDEASLNKHISAQIDAYVQRQRQEQIDQKYASYKSTIEHTKTGSHIYGNEDARFTLVEYSDTECPYCKQYHQVPKAVVDASHGSVNWQWKHLPLQMHNPVAAVQSQAAECVSSIAGNKAFWVWINHVFEETKGNGQGAGDLALLAQNIGIDVDRFVSCVNSGQFREKIAADIQSANNLGVNSTPSTFVVDNQTGKNISLRGVVSEAEIAAAVEQLKSGSAELNQQEPEQ